MPMGFALQHKIRTADDLRAELERDPRGHDWILHIGKERAYGECIRCGLRIHRPRDLEFPDCDTYLVNQIQEE